MDSTLQVLSGDRALHVLQKRLDATEPGYIAQHISANFKFARAVLKMAKKQNTALADVGSIPGVCRFCRGRRGKITACSTKVIPFAYDICEECFIDEYRSALDNDTKSEAYYVVITPLGGDDNPINTQPPPKKNTAITVEFIPTGIAVCAGGREYCVTYDEIVTTALPDDYPERDTLYHKALGVPTDVFPLLGIAARATIFRAIKIPTCATSFISGVKCPAYLPHIPPAMRYLEVTPNSCTDSKAKLMMDTLMGARTPLLHTKCGGCLGVTPLQPVIPRDYKLHIDHPMYIVYTKVIALKKKVQKLKQALPAVIVDTNRYITKEELADILPNSEDYF